MVNAFTVAFNQLNVFAEFKLLSFKKNKLTAPTPLNGSECANIV